MARDTRSTPSRTGVADLLASPRFEVMPFDGFDEQVTHLPEGTTITVTASPTLGLEATVEKSELAAARGYEVVPHVAARHVRDVDHLIDIADRLSDAGITDVFVLGGDREAAIGEFESAHAILARMDDLGLSFEEVGITGYPEGHPFLDEATLAESMARKRPYATYVTTQLCFDPGTILGWIEEIRARGVDLPVHVGVPGVIRIGRLLGISRKVGVGDSVKFLEKTTGVVDLVRRLAGSRGAYAPDDVVEGIAPHGGDPAYGICGLHVSTFNRVQDTEAWRRKRLSDAT